MCTLKKQEIKEQPETLEVTADTPLNTTNINEFRKLVKNRARERMAEGVERLKIKNLIKSHGGNFITDLDEVALGKVYNKLEKMTND